MLNELVKRYRKYNPETGEFNQQRTIREYARLIGVNSGQLTQILNGIQKPGVTVIERLAAAFPDSPIQKDIASAFAGQPPSTSAAEKVAVAV